MRELHLFAGAGGSLLSGLILGHVPVCAVELDPYCRAVLLQRQRDGLLPWFPVWDDVRTFDGTPWRGRVELVSGGFPCQDISNAGKRAGLSGARSGLWTEFARIIWEVRPRYAFIENVPALTVRGLDRVLADLAALGLDVRWCCLGADDVGAPHIRKRLWLLATDPAQQYGTLNGQEASQSQRRGETLADAECPEWRPYDMACRGAGRQLLSQGQESPAGIGTGCKNVANPTSMRVEEQPVSTPRHIHNTHLEWASTGDPDFQGLEIRQSVREDPQHGQSSVERAGWWESQSDVGRLADGVATRLGSAWATEPADVPRVVQYFPHRRDRLKALGNGWVPAVAVQAWHILMA